MLNAKYRFKFFTSIERVGQLVWDELAKDSPPFNQYKFLHALESSGSVGGKSGWLPFHLVIYQHNQAVGVLPMYKKSHSYGEYVFDFAWANTYRQYGLNYYPKLVAAIPFTPVTGPRLMLNSLVDVDDLLPILTEQLKNQLQVFAMSSMHWLFLDKPSSDLLTQHGQTQRTSVQFEWFNRHYSSFANYLQHFNSRKRKSVKKERAKIIDAGVRVIRLHGKALTRKHMQFFYSCYKQTYLKRSGHEGYLTQAFFQQIFDDLHDNLMIVMACKEDESIASALFVFNQAQLFGRYWGALEDVESLHFECCYYQGIEFCIEQNIQRFNPGTQGEHKILRGFEPIYCYSNHVLKEPAFHEAVERFVLQEKSHMEEYKSHAEQLLPYKQPD